MPDAVHFTEKNIRAALANHSLSMAQIDESCSRILSGWYKLPADKRLPCGGEDCINRNVSTAYNKALARKLSAMSTVLLKNEPAKPGRGHLLPLDLHDGYRVALIGPDAENPYTAGSGSGGVLNSNVAVSPLQAFRGLPGLDVLYVHTIRILDCDSLHSALSSHFSGVCSGNGQV
jgi:beta-glucosidase-like glycosyl hydrolase